MAVVSSSQPKVRTSPSTSLTETHPFPIKSVSMDWILLGEEQEEFLQGARSQFRGETPTARTPLQHRCDRCCLPGIFPSFFKVN